jgi:hypothetical protein
MVAATAIFLKVLYASIWHDGLLVLSSEFPSQDKIYAQYKLYSLIHEALTSPWRLQLHLMPQTTDQL